MPDDLDLLERFEPLATAPFVEPTATSALVARVAQRRRTRRLAASGAAIVIAIVASLGAVAVVGAPSGDGPADELRTVAPSEAEESSVPASYGTGPRLVLGAVPEELASEGCSTDFFGPGDIACTLGQPATPDENDGIILVLQAASPAEQAAWDRGDAATLAQEHGHDDAEFRAIGGRDVLDLGERRTPSPKGRPERVTHSYQVLAGAFVIEVFTEGVTEEQVAEVIRGLGTEPVDLGFAISVDALPAGARAIAQGQERLWYQPDPQDPSRSDDNGGLVAGITYAVGDEVVPVAVHVVRGVDAADYIEAWAQQQPGDAPETEPITANGRIGAIAQVRFRGIPEEAGEGEGERIAVAVDDETVIIVEGKVSQHDALVAIAGRTRVADSAPAPAPTAPGSSTGEDGGTTAAGTGWYLPADLPDGWVLDRGQAQAADSSGEAQLWLTSPSGNVFVVTLKVPRGGTSWRSPEAVRHEVPGSDWPVYLQPEEENGPSYRSLVANRPDADVLVDLLGTPKGGEPSPLGNDETDELLAALVPASTDEWRAYLGGVPATPALLEADTLVDLPDET